MSQGRAPVHRTEERGGIDRATGVSERLEAAGNTAGARAPGSEQGEEHMGKLEGKVAFITGAARGQGRSHAIRLAQEGADIIAVDICAADRQRCTYPMATPDDLAETVKQVEALDRRIFAAPGRRARRQPSSSRRSTRGVAELGPVDIVLANAGIAPMAARPSCTAPGRTSSTSTSPACSTPSRPRIPSMIERGAGRRDRADQLHRRDQRHRRPDPRRPRLHARPSTAWSGSMRSYANNLAPHQHPGEHRPPHRRAARRWSSTTRWRQFLAEPTRRLAQRDGQRAPGRHGRAGRHLQRDRCGWSPTTPATSPA